MCSAQSADRWRGMVIGEGDPESALEKLGKPQSDKMKSFKFSRPPFILKEIRDKKFRILEYNNIKEFSSVQLGFTEENKLFVIHLEPKKLDIQTAIISYPQVEFESPDFTKTPIYTLIGSDKSSGVVMEVNNAKNWIFRKALTGSIGNNYLGQVRSIELIDIKLFVQAKGADILK